MPTNVITHPLHLPEAPTTEEKYLYTKRHAVWFSVYGLFSLGCTLTAMVFWMNIAPLHYLYIIYFIVYGLWLGHTYSIGLIGTDFSIKKHNELVAKYQAIKSRSVDVYLPVCGEPIDIIENSMSNISKMTWPGKLVRYVLDDGGDKRVADLAKKYKFEYICRPNRGEMKKSGNLRYAFSQTKGDFIAIFDADFCPRNDFLSELMPYFEANPKNAIVQSPQFFHTYEEQNAIQKGFIYKQELFYKLIQPSRDIFGGAVCVGTNAIYRREALEPFGGTALIGHSEDMHTGYNCVSTGWNVKYVSLILAKGLAPSTLATYYTQQYRWALGNMVLIFSKKFWMAHVPFFLKMNYVASILYYISFSFGIFCNVIPAISMIVFYPDKLEWYHFLLAVPTFLLGYFIQPLWSISRWNLSSISVSEAARYSALFSFVDMIRGKEMGWVSTGDTQKANKLKSYEYYRLNVLGWNTVFFVLLFGGSLYHLLTRDTNKPDFAWYPILFFSALYYFVQIYVLRPEVSQEREAKTQAAWSAIPRLNFRAATPILTIFVLAFGGLMFLVNAQITTNNNNNTSTAQVAGVSEGTQTQQSSAATTQSTDTQTIPVQSPTPSDTSTSNNPTPDATPIQPVAFSYVAQSGDSLSVLARKAILQFEKDYGVTHTNAQRMYIEGNLIKDNNYKTLNQGEAVSFDTNTLQALSDQSKNLDPHTLALWDAYAQNVTF